MTGEELGRLTGQIGTLRTECEVLRVRNEILQYELDRKTRLVRELEREVQEWRALYRNHRGDEVLTGWGKGKDE